MGQKKNNSGEGDKKKDDTPVTVVLNIDMHCEGCATKIIKTVKGFQGVESAKAESKANKLTLIGKVDPSKVQESLAQKTKKKVELVSPKKDNKDKKEKKNDGENNNNNDDDEDGDKKKKDADKNSKDKSDEKKLNDKEKGKQKSKEPPVTTVVLKLSLHCQGCLQKIHKTISRSKGFIEISIDKEKELVTVKGAMDMKALAENLKEKLKRPVEIVPPKKEKNGEKGSEDANEQKNGSKDNNGGGGGGGGKKKKGGGGNGGQEHGGGDNGDGGKMEGSKMEYLGPIGFGYGFGYGNPYQHGLAGYANPYQHGLAGYANTYGCPYQFAAEPPMQVHPPQMFSDENPNACSIM